MSGEAPTPAGHLRERLLALAAAAGRDAAEPWARELAGMVDEWWEEQRAWEEEIGRRLEVHEDIRNALVGMRGHIQLMRRSRPGESSELSRAWEVVDRESKRIEQAADRLREGQRLVARPEPAGRAAHAA